MSKISTINNDKVFHFIPRAVFISLTLICFVFYMLPSLSFAATCRDRQSVQASADAAKNTNMGGHLTQHIDGMNPPSGTSQVNKTLFESQRDYNQSWKRYMNINTAVNCGGRGQAQQTVPITTLGFDYLGALSCREADLSGKCTKWDSYMAQSVFFGFIQRDGKWILNTAFPIPQP